VSNDSSLGAERLFGNASEPLRDSGGAEPGRDVMRVFKVAAGASEGARELARAFAACSFALGTGVIDRGAGLLVRDGRFAAVDLHPDWLSVDDTLL
jgi:hypothetical protein